MSQSFLRLVSSLLICLSVVFVGKILDNRLQRIEEQTWENVDRRVIALIKVQDQMVANLFNAVIQYDINRDDIIRNVQLQRSKERDVPQSEPKA